MSEHTIGLSKDQIDAIVKSVAEDKIKELVKERLEELPGVVEKKINDGMTRLIMGFLATTEAKEMVRKNMVKFLNRFDWNDELYENTHMDNVMEKVGEEMASRIMKGLKKLKL